MTIHSERKERIEDYRRMVKTLNERIESLNQELLVARVAEETKQQFAPLIFQVIEEKGDGLVVKTILRQSRVGYMKYEILVV
jgi:hypothetical protein